MSRPTRFEQHRYLGDKRRMVVHDLDHTVDACAIDELMESEAFLGFGPDTLGEARNRCFRPCRHCIRAREGPAGPGSVGGTEGSGGSSEAA